MKPIQDIQLEMVGAVAVVRLCRPAKRNALSDGLVQGLRNLCPFLPDRGVGP